MTATESAIESSVAPVAAPSHAIAEAFVMSWDKVTTPLEAIERASYALADQFSGAVSDGGSSWALSVHPRSARANIEALEHRVRQEVNDQALRVRIAERTDPIRNLVFALAFSRSGLTQGGGTSASEDTHS